MCVVVVVVVVKILSLVCDPHAASHGTKVKKILEAVVRGTLLSSELMKHCRLCTMYSSYTTSSSTTSMYSTVYRAPNGHYCTVDYVH